MAESRVPESVQRVTAFLEGRALMPHLDPEEINGVHVRNEDQGRPLLVSDLHDLVRRALLLDSLDAEVDRLGEIIREQRVELGKASDRLAEATAVQRELADARAELLREVASLTSEYLP